VEISHKMYNFWDREDIQHIQIPHTYRKPSRSHLTILKKKSTRATTLSKCTSLHATLKQTVIIPAKVSEYVFTGVGLSVCVSVCDHDN